MSMRFHKIGPCVLTAILLVPACVGSEAEPIPSSSNPGEEGPDASGPTTPPSVDGVPGSELTEEFGVFVATPGGPDADGSRAKPYGTIRLGLERAKATGKRLYVCKGVFKEAVVVASGVSMLGGFDCSAPDWKKAGRTTIESPSSPALLATDIEVATRVDGFDVKAPDGTASKPTSIGLLAKNASALTLADGSLVAGNGHDGAAGVEGTALTFVAVAAPKQGNEDWRQSDTVFVPGVGASPKPRPQNQGGAGGTATCSGATGISGGAGGPGGAGGTYTASPCNSRLCVVPGRIEWFTSTSPGQGGAGQGLGARQGNDGASATSPGTFTADGFVPADGVAGTSGTPGKGGAGGGGGSTPGRAPQWEDELGQGATGSGGGAGGCPGQAGSEGKGGGASIGALITDSPGLSFKTFRITTRDGGNGGRGTFGSSPTLGGSPAAARSGAGNAQPGQAGGRAGVSGSGAGGSSVGIAHRGGVPSLVDSPVSVGRPGSGVSAEQTTDQVGNTKELPASIAGVAVDLVAF